MTDNNLLAALLETKEFQLPAPPELTGDAIVVGDVHVPYMSKLWCQRVAEVGKRMLKPPRRLIIAGDFFDYSMFGVYESIVKEPEWFEEREAAKALLKYWMGTFQHIDLTRGNHESRLIRWTNGEFDTTDIMALVISNPDRVRMTVRGFCTLRSGGQAWRITHPKNASITRLGVADTLALKYKQHILSFHEHQLAMGWCRYGDYMIVQGGCLVDGERMAYHALDDSKAGAWVNGFVVIKDGCPTLYGPEPMTRWNK